MLTCEVVACGRNVHMVLVQQPLTHLQAVVVDLGGIIMATQVLQGRGASSWLTTSRGLDYPCQLISHSYRPPPLPPPAPHLCLLGASALSRPHLAACLTG